MLPKLAANLLHASRATYGQAVNFRNVLQFQTSFPPPPSVPTSASSLGASSSWGSGAGAGGANAKYHAGSRFYSGYAGSGSAIMHANSSTSQKTEDKDDHPAPHGNPPINRRPTLSLKTRPARRRSFSFTLDSQNRTGPDCDLGVLSAVQTHLRARHGFASSSRKEIADDTSAVLSTNPRPQSPLVEPSSRPLSRRNSTSSIYSSPPDELPPFMTNLAHDSPKLSPSSGKVDEEVPAPSDEDFAMWNKLNQAKQGGSWGAVVVQVEKMRASAQPSLACYNIAMDALMYTRSPGQPITLILQLYNEIIARGLLPNIRTYRTVIEALCNRDQEVHQVLSTLDGRAERRALADQDRTFVSAFDAARSEKLRSEGNFDSALALFNAVVASGAYPLTTRVYNALLRACAVHGDVDSALRVFTRLEKERGAAPDSRSYAYLIRSHAAVKDAEAAAEVFKTFLLASEGNQIQWQTGSDALRAQVQPWNAMIEAYMRCDQPEKALELLEKMMDSPSTSFNPTSIPNPSTSTYATIIKQFISTGDIQSAVAWLDRLIDQGKYVADSTLPVPFVPLPDMEAWTSVITVIAKSGTLEDLNRRYSLFTEFLAKHNLSPATLLHSLVVDVNLKYLHARSVGDSTVAATVDDLLKLTPLDFPRARTPYLPRILIARLVEILARHGFVNEAALITIHHLKEDQKRIQELPAASHLVNEQHRLYSQALARCLHAISGSLPLETSHSTLDLPTALDLLAFAPQPMSQSILVKTFQRVQTIDAKAVSLSPEQWSMVAESYFALSLVPKEREHLDFKLLIHALASAEDPATRQAIDQHHLAQALLATHSHDEATALLESYDPSAVQYLVASPTATLSSFGLDSQEDSSRLSDTSAELPTTNRPSSDIRIDIPHSRFVDEHQYANTGVTPLIAYDRLQKGVENNLYPSPESLGRLINALGRQGELEKVQYVYHIAQVVLNNLEHDKHWQSSGWFQVEDHMVIAYAHAGDLDTAGIHRVRIIEHRGIPSADAYGALISCVRDTTDDASIARELFEESQRLGVRANIFLYNTIISKLSRARKADYALDLFRRMKESGLRPSSVTYGAVIGACCRVGDEESATVLFEEMTSMSNFKPRVPPYNTMIQFFTQTKPNREKALYYYNSMRNAGVAPSAHTYKLLIDAHGAVEPVDMESAQAIFDQLVADRSVTVQGTHWAALINAWGCVRRDIDRAIAVFESIPSHPSTLRSRSSLPDAVVYESLINVFVTLHRMDLVPTYLQRLQDSGIHPTAYIMNLLIKGHAASGDMEKAREIFASLQDPEIGVAAPNNHAAHDGVSVSTSAAETVYREPSTWEAMVRAELGAGERQRAGELLDRMETRMFPPAVTSRIRGIMRDESVISI